MGLKFDRLGPIPWGGLRGGPRPKLNFLEYGHVAFKIKANDACSNMVTTSFPTDTPSTPWVESKGQAISFSERSLIIVAYQIIGN